MAARNVRAGVEKFRHVSSQARPACDCRFPFRLFLGDVSKITVSEVLLRWRREQEAVKIYFL